MTLDRVTRSKKRLFMGGFAIFLGLGLLVGFNSSSLYFGIGLFGPAGFSAVMIVLGISLIFKRDPPE